MPINRGLGVIAPGQNWPNSWIRSMTLSALKYGTRLDPVVKRQVTQDRVKRGYLILLCSLHVGVGALKPTLRPGTIFGPAAVLSESPASFQQLALAAPSRRKPSHYSPELTRRRASDQGGRPRRNETNRMNDISLSCQAKGSSIQATLASLGGAPRLEPRPTDSPHLLARAWFPETSPAVASTSTHSARQAACRPHGEFGQ